MRGFEAGYQHGYAGEPRKVGTRRADAYSNGYDSGRAERFRKDNPNHGYGDGEG